MATNYPGSLDSGTQQPSPSATTEMDDSGFEHDVVHTNHSGAIIALETKVGTGDSNAVANSVLAGTGSGTSGWTTGTLANAISGNAATATALETARNIGGVSFNGTANINLPGVNTAGNQNTSGNAATATSLATARTIDITGDITATAVAFDGTANIAISASVNNDSHTHDTQYVKLAGSTMTGELQLNARLDVGNGTGGDHEIRIYKADNNVSDHIQFYNGTTRVGEIGCEDTTWLRINQETGKNIYTPRMIRADGGYQAKDGTNAAPAYTFFNDTNTGMYRYGSDSIGFATGGGFRARIQSDGIHLASGDWFRAYGTAGIYWQTYGGGWNMSDTTWIRAYGSKGILTAGGMAAALSATTSTSGYNYVMRNATYTSFAYYTSSRDVKENIVDVTAADSGAWIDALQPVQFNERYLGEGEESGNERAWREADIQVGFIAEDVLDNAATAQFSQVKEEDGELKATGWKWECVIAASVAEIKALRARVAELEAA